MKDAGCDRIVPAAADHAPESRATGARSGPLPTEQHLSPRETIDLAATPGGARAAPTRASMQLWSAARSTPHAVGLRHGPAARPRQATGDPVFRPAARADADPGSAREPGTPAQRVAHERTRPSRRMRRPHAHLLEFVVDFPDVARVDAQRVNEGLQGLRGAGQRASRIPVRRLEFTARRVRRGLARVPSRAPRTPCAAHGQRRERGARVSAGGGGAGLRPSLRRPTAQHRATHLRARSATHRPPRCASRVPGAHWRCRLLRVDPLRAQANRVTRLEGALVARASRASAVGSRGRRAALVQRACVSRRPGRTPPRASRDFLRVSLIYTAG